MCFHGYEQETLIFTKMWILVVCLVSLTGHQAVQVKNVELVGARYVKVGGSGLLTCDFVLDNTETLESVIWLKDNEIVYEWQPQLGSQVTGVLVGYAQEGKPGWNLNLRQAVVSLEGNYTCEVKTDKGTASGTHQLLVLMLCKARIETEDSTGINCTVTWSIDCSRIYPDLNFTAGIYLPEEEKFFDKATTWTKIVYSDNTFGYNLIKSYNVSDIPKTSVFLWNISYKDQFSLVTGNFSFGAVHRSGCPPPPARPNMHQMLLGAQTTCRGELVPQTDTLQAIYSCDNDIIHGNRPTHKTLICHGDKWLEENTDPWPSCSD
ncbi:uncharacterized protein [Periplaneta americana]|uniref:uncharacterized protein n=1 Tax=Periplaneta americana TaxID=6978 RepID=UPI0037E96867